jgi:hypothetical protein
VFHYRVVKARTWGGEERIPLRRHRPMPRRLKDGAERSSRRRMGWLATATGATAVSEEVFSG